MALWLDGFKVGFQEFRMREPKTDAWIAFKTVPEGFWVVPKVYSSQGRTVLQGGRFIRGGQPFLWEEEDAYIRATPLKPGLVFNPEAPPTAPGDLQLTIHAFNRAGELTFNIESDRFVVLHEGLAFEIYGPGHPFPEEVEQHMSQTGSG